jgi:hypothetical protein
MRTITGEAAASSPPTAVPSRAASASARRTTNGTRGDPCIDGRRIAHFLPASTARAPGTILRTACFERFAAASPLPAPPPREEPARPRRPIVQALSDLSIRRKLTLIMLFTTSVVFFLTAVAFCTYDIVTLRRRMVEDLTVMARIIDSNTAAQMLFNEQEPARRSWPP